jgi:hypothetical protein
MKIKHITNFLIFTLGVSQILTASSEAEDQNIKSKLNKFEGN